MLLIFSSYFLYQAPTIGISSSWDDEQKGWRVTAASPWSPFKKGDIVREVGDVKIAYNHFLTDIGLIKEREIFHWYQAKKALFKSLQQDPASIRIERKGNLIPLSLSPRKLGFTYLKRPEGVHIVTALLYFLIGIIILHKNRKSSEIHGLLFSTFSVFHAYVDLVFMTGVLSEPVFEPVYALLMALIDLGLVSTVPPVFLHFTLTFPERRPFLKARPWIIPLCYAVGLSAFLSLHVTIILSSTGILFLFSILSICHAYLRSKKPIERQQMKWIAGGVCFSVIPWFLLGALPVILTGERIFHDDTVSMLSFMVMPVFFAFAIRKYRLFDIDALFEGTFVYGITLTMIACIDFALLSLLSINAGETIGSGGSFALFLVLILTVSIYAVIRDAVRSLIKKVFHKGALDESSFIKSFTDRAAGLASEAILQILEETIDTAFKPEKMKRVTNAPQDRLKTLKNEQGLIHLWKDAGYSRWTGQKYDLALLIEKKGKPDCVLYLGEFANRNRFSKKGFSVLTALLKQTNLLYENAALYEEGMKIREKSVAVKEKMLKELHDGLGGITTNIFLLSELGQKSDSLSDTKKKLMAISGLSKESLFEIRNFMQGLDDKERNWETLLTVFKNQGTHLLKSHGLSFNFIQTISEGCKNPDSLLYLNLYRIYKEALTNIIKHAGASSVEAAFTINPTKLHFTIEDNGIGLKGGRRKGMGISNMTKRAKEIGGSLKVSPEKGTRICLELEF